MTNIFSVDENASKKRYDSLREYYRKNVFTVKEGKGIPKCKSYEDCKDSYRCFYQFQAPHIGRYYDLKRKGKPFRVMIVGQEFGGKCESRGSKKSRYLTFSETRHAENNCRKMEFCCRNPHMKGVTSVLRLLFSKGLGEDRDSEKINLSGGRQRHVFDGYALVNYLICSRVAESGSMNGRSTKIMKERCREHFEKTVKILEPNIVIIQGERIGNDVLRVFGERKVKNRHLYTGHIGTQEVLVAAFSHPSARGKMNWGTSKDTVPYMRDVVKPVVSRMLHNFDERS